MTWQRPNANPKVHELCPKMSKLILLEQQLSNQSVILNIPTHKTLSMSAVSGAKL